MQNNTWCESETLSDIVSRIKIGTHHFRIDNNGGKLSIGCNVIVRENQIVQLVTVVNLNNNV